MRRALRLLAVTLGVLLSGALAGAVVLAGWIGFTPAGTRWVLAQAQQLDGFALHVDDVQGRLVGPLALRGLRLELSGLRIEVDHARLSWSPLWLVQRRLHIEALEGGELRITLLPTAPDQNPEPPSIPVLPLQLAVVRAQLDAIELRTSPDVAPQRVTAVSLDNAAWLPDYLSVEKLAATHGQTGPLELRVQAQLAPAFARVQELLLRVPGETPAQLEAKGLVHLDAQPSQLDLQWQQLRWPLKGEPQIDSRSGAASLRGTLDDLHVLADFALGERAQVQADARYAASLLKGRFAWRDLGWPLHGEPRLRSALGVLMLDGKPADYRYTLEAQLAAEGRQGRAQARGSGGLQHLVLDALNLAAAKSQIEGSARVDWALNGELAPQVQADLRLKNLDPGLIAPEFPGRLNGRVQARVQQVDGQPRSQFEIALKNSQLRSYPLTLDARGNLQGGRVHLDAFTLASGRTRLSASGQVTPPFRLDAQLSSPDLAALWPGLSGRANVDAKLRGTRAAPQLIARGSADNLGYENLRLARVQLDADVALAGVWKLDLSLRELNGPAVVHRAQLRVDGTQRAHQIALEVNAEPAQAQLTANGSLDLARRAWSGEISSARVQPAELAAWTLEEPAALRADTARVQLEPACWRAPDSRLCVQLQREAARLRTAFRVEQLDFDYFAPFLPAGWTLTGGIDGTALVELRDGKLVEASADLSTDPISFARDGQLLLSAERGSLHIDEDARAAVARLNLPLQGGLIAFDGELAGSDLEYAQRPLRAQLKLQLDDLGFLRALSEELTLATGRIDGALSWSGTLAAPQPSGEIALRDARLGLATPGITLEDLSASLRSGADGALALLAQATSDGGSLCAEGRVQPFGPDAGADIALRGEDFRAVNLTEAHVWVSPELRVQASATRVQVTGEVRVPRAEIEPVSFDGGVAPSRDQVIVTGEDGALAGPALQVLADVRLVLGEKVSFEGFGLKTRLTGAVRVIESPRTAGSARGEVRLVEGRYKAYGQDLEIETGRLLFNGGPLTEPALEIRALRKPREDIEVGVFVRGTLDEPEFQLFSTPAMPRERQLSWLVLGRSLEEGGGADERAMLASAALSLGLTGTDFLAQNLRGDLGLDEVSIGAAPGEDAEQARFTVGKYLSPKLYVSYGLGLFQPGQVFKLLYDLGRGFKFSTESGVHTGGDLLYSFER